MFEHLVFFGLTFPEIFVLFILFLLCAVLTILFISLYNNKNKVNFYSLIVRENGRVSKVGIAFLFILTLFIYQVIAEVEVSTYLVELLGVIFAAELGTKYVDGKLSQTNLDKIKTDLSNVDIEKKTASAKNIDNIDFDKL